MSEAHVFMYLYSHADMNISLSDPQSVDLLIAPRSFKY